MHKMSIQKLLSDGKASAIADMLTEVVDKLKKTDYDLYLEFDRSIYECAYGSHMSDALLEKIYSNKINKHWTKDQTTSVARNVGCVFDKMNECDFNYAMNYLYHTLSGSIGNVDANAYGKMAKNWLENNNPLKHFYYLKTL